jgi:hypothetical protein
MEDIGMKYNKLGATLGSITGILTLAIGSGGFGAITSAHSMPTTPHSMGANQTVAKRYRVNLRPLNNSGVHGTADIILDGRELTVTVRASGMTPNMIHAQHIHGQTTAVGAAECPTAAQDINMDGFISVTEGAPKYGPIKLNLTNPQTPFGPNNTVLNGVKLFTDFAGVPMPENFPKADENGNLYFTNTYLFDTNNAAANAAFETLNPLTKDVETAAGGGTTMAYDGLLPVACARITAVGNLNSHHGHTNEDDQGITINTTGPTSHDSVNETSSSNTDSHNSTIVTVSNNNNQTATSGEVTTSGNTSSDGQESDLNNANWGDMNPMTWQINGQHFDNWWSHMNTHMTHYNANHWITGTSANKNWTPTGNNWQNTWTNWDPTLWQMNGQSYGKWYSHMLRHMTSNYSNWSQNWNNLGDSNVNDTNDTEMKTSTTDLGNNVNTTVENVTVENKQ